MLKSAKPVTKATFLADISYDEELLQLCQDHTTQELREYFGFLRLLYINAQGEYLLKILKHGCPQCGGTQELPSPVEAADPQCFPLETRHKLMAMGIHQDRKSVV